MASSPFFSHIMTKNTHCVMDSPQLRNYHTTMHFSCQNETNKFMMVQQKEFKTGSDAWSCIRRLLTEDMQFCVDWYETISSCRATMPISRCFGCTIDEAKFRYFVGYDIWHNSLYPNRVSGTQGHFTFTLTICNANLLSLKWIGMRHWPFRAIWL